MAEEVRFFVRTLIYTVAITIVYWVVTREPTGTVLFAGVIAAAVAAAGLLLLRAPATRRGRKTPAGLVAFDDDDQPDRAMAVDEAEFPAASPWPLVAAIAATLVAVGLIYGAWLWLPGLALGATTAGAWIRS